jgi:hypothetical protein
MLEHPSWYIIGWAKMGAGPLEHTYMSAFNGNSEEALRLIEQDPVYIKYALIGAVHGYETKQGNHLVIIRACIGRVDYFWLRVGLLAVVNSCQSERTQEMLEIFVDRVGTQTLGAALIRAIECSRHTVATICLDRGATNFMEALDYCRAWTPPIIVQTILEKGAIHWPKWISNFMEALQKCKAWTPPIIVQTILEKGAIHWPKWIYSIHLRNSDFVIQLHKMGIPHYLLVNGRAHIQAIIDEHEAWNAHIKAELGSLGVYSVLADLITQY